VYGLHLLQKGSGIGAITTGMADGYLAIGRLFTDLDAGGKSIERNAVV